MVHRMCGCMETRNKMNRLRFTACAWLVMVTALAPLTSPAQKSMDAGKMIYKLRLNESSSQTISVLRTAKDIQLHVEGIGKSMTVRANGGGVETCRTIISYENGGSRLMLSLPIPMPNTPCQMTPGTVMLEGAEFGALTGEKEVAKVSGNDVQLRKAVEQLFGKITRTAPSGDE